MPESQMLAITVNGEQRTVAEGTSAAALVRLLGADPARVVVECNREILPAASLEQTMVRDADTFEIIQFVGGG